MTKTLTEQWCEGTIDWGLYYVKVIGRNDITIADTNLDEELNVEEVLAPVPSYDEYKRLVSNSDELPTEQVLTLQKMVEDECSRRCELETKCSQLEKRLEIATKALKKLKRPEKDYLDYIIDKDGNKIDLRSIKVATKALKEMEGVK